MILFDFSQLVHQAVHANFARTKETITEQFLKHIILSTIFAVKKKVKSKDDIILCCDGKHYWRKDKFPYYKANRKLKPKDPNGVNWDELYPVINAIKDDFKNNLPIKVLEVDKAEGDDLIYFLSMYIREPIIIVSSDRDFLQIQEFRKDVKQFSAIQNKFLNVTEHDSLLEKVLAGDTGDGIPNYLSDDDTFVNTEKKQKAFTKKLRESAIAITNGYQNPELIVKSLTELENFNRNKSLIDLREIPEDILNLIRDKYEELDISKRKWFNYCVINKLVQLMESQPWTK